MGKPLNLDVYRRARAEKLKDWSHYRDVFHTDHTPEEIEAATVWSARCALANWHHQPMPPMPRVVAEKWYGL